jgi:hypothetical protein
MKEQKYKVVERSDEPVFSKEKGYDVKKDVYTYKKVSSADTLKRLAWKINPRCDLCDMQETIRKSMKIGEYIIEKSRGRTYMIIRMSPKQFNPPKK